MALDFFGLPAEIKVQNNIKMKYNHEDFKKFEAISHYNFQINKINSRIFHNFQYSILKIIIVKLISNRYQYS